MNYELVQLKEKTVIGLTKRTKNSDENMGMIIGGLWTDFYQKGIYSAIQNKVNQKSLGIYSEYESDANSEYSVTVACEVLNAVKIPADTIVKTIPAGTYAKFIVQGHMQRAVSEFWQELWKMDLNRNFICDFEEYQNASIEDAIIHIYIGITA